MMDESIRAELKKKLEEERIRLTEELKVIAKPTEAKDEFETQHDNIGTNWEENATEVEEYADNLALEDNLEKQLKEVDEALVRMENGTYGVCDNCKQEIDVERLRAYPSAKTCIKCYS